MLRLAATIRGLLDNNLRTLAPNGKQGRRRSSTVALKWIMPKLLAREWVEAVDVAVGGNDEPVAVEQQSDVAGLHLVVGPDDFTRVAVKGEGVAIETDEDKLVDGHGHSLYAKVLADRDTRQINVTKRNCSTRHTPKYLRFCEQNLVEFLRKSQRRI
jgi:hypothetical protein